MSAVFSGMLFALGSMDPVPGQKPAEDALSNLASHGILGSICVLLAVALFLAVRALLKSKDDRVTDQKAMTDALGKVNEAAKDLAIQMKEHAANQLVEANKSQETVRSALASQERSFQEVRNVVSNLQTSVNNLQQEQTRLTSNLDRRHGKVAG